MKNISFRRIFSRFFVILMIASILCGDVMIANAQTVATEGIPEGVEIELVNETSAEEAVVEELISEDVSEEVSVEESETEMVEEETSVTEEIFTEEAVEEFATEIPEAGVVTEELPATEAISGTHLNLTWSLANGTLTISGSGEMSVSGTYPDAEDYPWYEHGSQVSSVVVGDDVTNIGIRAFCKMTNLTSVKIGSGVTRIVQSSFSGCTSLKSVTIPAAVTDIEYNSFGNCSALQTVTFAEGSQLTHIGTYAFQNCIALEEITFPDSLRIIDTNCFQKCTGLKKVTFGKELYGLYTSAFAGCSALASIDLPDKLVVIETTVFSGCSSLKTITIPKSVNKIGSNAFSGCTGLDGIITIPETVDSLGESVFAGCTGLDGVVVNSPAGITGGMFSKCSSLTSVTIGSQVKEIKKGAFQYCELLKTITVPSPVESIEDYAFAYCDNLQTVILGSSVKTIGNYVFWDSPISVFKNYCTTTSYGTNIFSADDFTSASALYGYFDSTTQKYATANKYTFKPIKPLEVPTYRKIVNIVSGVHIYWNAVDNAKTYNLYRSTSRNSGYELVKSGITTSHYVDTTVTSGKTYYYKVQACNGTIKCTWPSTVSSITYVGTPDITSRVNNASGIKLGWNKISGATGYAIYRKPFNGNTWTRVKTITGNTTFTWTDTSVKANNGTVYKYTIRALAGSNRATLSGCRNTGRTMARLSSQVLSSAKKASSTTIKCSWTTSSAVTGYEVRFMVGSTVYRTFTVGSYKTGTKTFEGLKAGQTYKIQVRTYKKVSGVGSFYSAWSEAKYVKL